jgi:hypothetical protein
MRSLRFPRKVAVFEDLRRPRLGERQERAAADQLRPRRSSALLAVVGMGFKSGPGPEPGLPIPTRRVISVRDSGDVA